MNLETQLRIQAWVDGELPEAEALRIRELVERDASARTLADELETMRASMAGNEAPVTLAGSREFYWSRIRREIERIEAAGTAAEETPGGLLRAWRRWLMPLAGTAMVAVAAVGLAWLAAPSTTNGESFLAEIENLSDDVGSYSFRAPGQNMFVVWVYDKAATPAADTEFPDETSLQ
jgi:negative regulator of sigma E activity